MWLTFAPIPEFTAAYYRVSVDDVNWFSLSFFLVSLVVGLLSIVVLDTAGLRVSVRGCAMVGGGRDGWWLHLLPRQSDRCSRVSYELY